MNKIYLFLVFSILTTIGMAQEKIKQTAGRDQLGTFAPKFAELNDDVLFGEVWSRTDRLGLRDRSLVTITSLISQGITDSSLTFHLQSARNNGITRTEIAEIITHIGFYAGWPKAWAAFRLAKEVWAEDTNGEDAKAAFQREMIFPIGEPNAAYARYFTGNSYLAPISREQVYISNVTFEPGCRNNWHIHRAKKGGGQMLIGVAGRGWYQEEGKPAVEILPGTVIHIPANVKHWHGAAADSWFAHLAFEIPGEGSSNEWLEPVNDEAYNKIRLSMYKFIFVLLVVVGMATASNAQEKQNMKQSDNKPLVAYFSVTGTTARAAEKLARVTGGELYAITPVESYTNADLDWNDKRSRSSVEMNDPKSRPAIQEAKKNIADYDVIFIGYPIWWNLAPRIIDTFIETHHLAGKTLIPFATSGGSGITNSVGALKKAYPDLNWKEGKLLNRMDENGIREWIGKTSKD